MSTAPPVVIVGTGPAGVSAAFPLAQAGLPVCLVEAGGESLPPPSASRPSLSELRHGVPDALDYLIGRDLGGLRDMSRYSPKLRTAASPSFVDGYAAANRIDATGFDLVGTTTPGGLSNIWGAVCSTFDDDDLGQCGLCAKDLAPSYRVVAERIGISGSLDDDMASFHGIGLPTQPAVPLSPMAQSLLDRYDRTEKQADFKLGRSRNAVLSQGIGTRKSCTQDNLCMWRCRHQAIYNAANDLSDLEAMPNVTVLRNLTVRRVGGSSSELGWAEGHRADGSVVRVAGRRILLAAGAIASARLALEAISRFDSPVPVVSAPAIAFAILLPSRLGRAIPAQSFGLSQLSFRLDLHDPRPGYALGLLYDAASISIADLVAHMPLTRAGAARVLAGLLPGLMIGLAYLPGEYSASHATLRKRADGFAHLDLRGAYAPEHPAAIQHLARGIRRHFARLGAWVLPGSISAYRPGAEVHYGGILPLGKATGSLGEMPDADAIHIIDGAVLPRVPAKHHTLTIMANADRIGRALARRWGHA